MRCFPLESSKGRGTPLPTVPRLACAVLDLKPKSGDQSEAPQIIRVVFDRNRMVALVRSHGYEAKSGYRTLPAAVRSNREEFSSKHCKGEWDVEGDCERMNGDESTFVPAPRWHRES